MNVAGLVEGLGRLGFEAREIGRPRIRGMRDYEVLLRGRRVVLLRVFEGRPPYYRAWAELYAVNWQLLGKKVAERLLSVLAGALEEPGERLYVEYAGLPDVDRMLQLGVEPEETWLGRVLASNGLRVRDMYFPEGFMEGGPKLVAEKPPERPRA